MSTKVEPRGFIVIEACDDYEQVLAIDQSKGLPPGGILKWATGRMARVFFPSRKDARAAIERTEHYRRAYGRSDLPEKANCRVELIAAVHDTELRERAQ